MTRIDQQEGGIMGNDEEFGVCDECGEYTDELVLIESNWICKTCSRMP